MRKLIAKVNGVPHDSKSVHYWELYINDTKSAKKLVDDRVILVPKKLFRKFNFSKHPSEYWEIDFTKMKTSLGLLTKKDLQELAESNTTKIEFIEQKYIPNLKMYFNHGTTSSLFAIEGYKNNFFYVGYLPKKDFIDNFLLANNIDIPKRNQEIILRLSAKDLHTGLGALSKEQLVKLEDKEKATIYISYNFLSS